MRKGFAPIVIVIVGLIVVVLVITGILYKTYKKPLTQTPTTFIPRQSVNSSASPSLKPVSFQTVDTTNWKTYTNSSLNFTIKHPDDITVLNISDSYQVIFGRKSEAQKDFREITTLTIVSRDNEPTPQQAFYNECPTENGTCKSKFESVTINNALGVKDVPPGARYFLKSKSGKNPVLLVSLLPQTNDKNYSEFEEMISTFQFIQ